MESQLIDKRVFEVTASSAILFPVETDDLYRNGGKIDSSMSVTQKNSCLTFEFLKDRHILRVTAKQFVPGTLIDIPD